MKELLKKIQAVSIGAILVFLSTPNNASAAYLYWGSPRVRTVSVQTCFSFANDTMRSLNFQNIRRSGNEVAGTRGSSYAAITCLGTNPNATAMVMVVGDNDDEVANTRNNLSDKISGITCFEGC